MDQETQNQRREWVKQLYKEYDRICYHYRLRLPAIIVDVRPLKRTLGSYDALQSSVTLSSQLILNHTWDVVLEVFKHEIAHHIVHHRYGISLRAHGTEFSQACDCLGVEAWARKAEILVPEKSLGGEGKSDSSDRNRLNAKLTKLFSLAQSKNENEAFLAMSKAHEIMEKYHIGARPEGERVGLETAVIHLRKRRIEAFEGMIASVLVNHFYVKIVFTSLYDAMSNSEHKAIEVLGKKHDVEQAIYVFWFLRNNTEKLWKSFRLNSDQKGISARNSYFEGVISAFHERLDCAREARNIELDQHERKPVFSRSLVRRDEILLEKYLNQRHPRLSSVKKGRRSRVSRSYREGRRVGRDLRLRMGVKDKRETQQLRIEG